MRQKNIVKLSDSPLNLCSLFKVLLKYLLVSYDVLKYCCISRAEHFLVDLITLGGGVTSHRGGAGWAPPIQPRPPSRGGAGNGDAIFAAPSSGRCSGSCCQLYGTLRTALSASSPLEGAFSLGLASFSGAVPWSWSPPREQRRSSAGSA